MSSILEKVFFCCIGIGATMSAWSQSAVRGRVLDENGQGVDAAVVMLVALPNNILLETALSDGDGRFALHMQEGDFILCVKVLGYKEVKRQISLTGVETLSDIRLEPDEISLNDAIIASRKSRPMTSSSNGRIMIHVSQSFLADIGSALDVLKHSPGISVNNKGEVSLATLGGTAIYVNGKKLMLHGEELSSYLRSLPSSKILRVETSPSPNASFGADGSGGIINIILKTLDRSGFYLTTSHGLSYWKNAQQNSYIALSYNMNQWQLGFNYNHNIGHYAMNYGYERIQNGNKSLSETADVDKRNTFSAGVDFSWVPNKRHRVFLVSSVSLIAGPGETQTTTHIFNGTSMLDGILRARNSYLEQINFRHDNSVSYRYSPSDRHALSVSADWIHFYGMARCEQPNDYYSSLNTLVRSDLFYSQPNKSIDVYAFLADYKHKPNERIEFLAGTKWSFIRSDNTFLFQKNGETDPLRSNRFFYNEKNIEAYAQYTHTYDRLTLSAGLRLEQMYTFNELLSQSNQKIEENRGNPLHLFPNVSVSYKTDRESMIAFVYNMRQDKPRYEDLNPFEYLLDEFSYWKGNPFLKPQISNKVMLSYARGSFSLNLYYARLDDYFASLTDVLDENKTIMTTKNIGKQQQVGLEAIYSKRLTPWWDFSSNVGAYYFVNLLDYETYKQEYRRPSCILSASNSILLPGGINFELSGRYYSKRQGGSYEVNLATGGVDLGLNKSWRDGRFRLALLMTDIFHTERWDSFGVKDNLSLSSWGYGESRKVILRLSYRFGKQGFDNIDKTLDELNRL